MAANSHRGFFMNISVFDLFSIGIGPSSSHTVGPMRAAYDFLATHDEHSFNRIENVTVTLYGSLAFTGVGHGTDKAILMGLMGEKPDTVNPDVANHAIQQLTDTHTLNLMNRKKIQFDLSNLQFNFEHQLPHHPNGMLFTSIDQQNAVIKKEIYYSVGGGFIVSDTQLQHPDTLENHPLPCPFENAAELLAFCEKEHTTVAGIMLRNELTWQHETSIREKLLAIAQAMSDSIKRGCLAEKTILPGGLSVRRRAPVLYDHLTRENAQAKPSAEYLMQWLDCFAIAVNEENAAGHRIVTAPTNGAAGIIPAVLEYFKETHSADEQLICEFLLTAGAIGILYKKNASISGAEMGCQGEVGVACSMAAGALAAVFGGNIYQVENAAEIGMEHNLGLTCDPIKGLVQIPCIERNAMGAVKAVNAAQLALAGDGQHKVSLDMVIKTMREIGENMSTKYKETSQGGLAMNVPEC
jgi:L-serine dehydratase